MTIDRAELRKMDPDKLRAMADAEDAAGCTSVGGLAADLGQPIHGPDRRLEEKEKITGDLCAICGIGFLLPSLRCDHCNQKGGDAMSRDFEDGPPLSRKARTMERLDQETLRERMRTTIGDVHVTPAELSALISSHESLAAELVTERAMHSAALERADALGEKLQECEAAGAAASETIFVLAKALRAAAYELNAIRARDGVPWTSSGYASGVSENYFSDVVENCFSALDSAGYQYVPWAFKEIQPLPAGRELLAELTAYREWVPRAVEAMKRTAEIYDAMGTSKQHEAFAPLLAAISSAPKGGSGG